MQHPELPIFAFLTAALVLVPIPWHWRARNVATLAMIFWLFVVDVIYGVNAIIWAGNVRNPVPIWCDITTKLVVGASYALPLATLCVCKHLEMVASSRKVSYDMNDRRRRMIFESIMCFGVPIIFMALHYIVQGHRYDIFENTGCQAAVYISIQAVFIIWFPQLLFSFITLIYAVLALNHFIRRRLTFAAHLQNSNSALTTNRYLRLIAMSLTEMVWGTVFTSYNLYNNVYPGLRPWTNWADVHSNFSRVDLYVTVGIPPAFLRTLMLFWWTMPASSIIFFVFFGFGEEAKKEYNKLWTAFKEKVLRKPSEKKGIQFLDSFPRSGNSGRRPLHLVELKSSASSMSADKKLPNTPLSMISSHPSTYTLSTPTPTKSEHGNHTEADTDADTFTISTFSYYGQSTMDPASPLPSTQHRIVISETFDASRAPSPVPSVPESVGPSSMYGVTEQDRVVVSPSPMYHRPFSPPSVYPVTVSQPTTAAASASQHPHSGIIVTIHRQASVDEIV